jgi:hypothetical protein
MFALLVRIDDVTGGAFLRGISPYFRLAGAFLEMNETENPVN